jgi:3-methyladenine DNA glycosylase AlkC
LALDGLEELELLPRAKHIAAALQRSIPSDVPEALDVLVRSLPPVVPVEENHDFSSFIFLPHAAFIGDYGVKHFHEGMRANYEVTQRFTAEYSIRPFLMQHTEQSLNLLHEWAADPSHHVRRLVSEGTRPRLPWASRLPMFQKDPSPVVELLDRLKDDPSLYVRRSVANNLNDIGKDNPEILFALTRKWLKGASADREWVVRHALRSAIKRAEPEALEILGYGNKAEVEIQDVIITPSTPQIGSSVKIEFQLSNSSRIKQPCLVDLQVHFVKANGSSSPKVFKLAEFDLETGEQRNVRKTISLKQHTTRTHYAGKHVVGVLVNGKPLEIGSFALVE